MVPVNGLHNFSNFIPSVLGIGVRVQPGNHCGDLLLLAGAVVAPVAGGELETKRPMFFIEEDGGRYVIDRSRQFAPTAKATVGIMLEKFRFLVLGFGHNAGMID